MKPINNIMVIVVSMAIIALIYLQLKSKSIKEDVKDVETKQEKLDSLSSLNKKSEQQLKQQKLYADSIQQSLMLIAKQKEVLQKHKAKHKFTIDTINVMGLYQFFASFDTLSTTD